MGGWVVQRFFFPSFFAFFFFPFSPTPFLLFCFKARAGAGRVGKNCAGGLGAEVRSEVYNKTICDCAEREREIKL